MLQINRQIRYEISEQMEYKYEFNFDLSSVCFLHRKTLKSHLEMKINDLGSVSN